MSGAVTRALAGSQLTTAIRDGIQAVQSVDRKYIAEAVRSAFADSLNLDEATRVQHPSDARWDYLLGHEGSSQVVALEAHSAGTSNVSEVVRKRAASRDHLRDHLRPGEIVAAWYWVASGRVDFVPHDKTINYLNQNGIHFVGRCLDVKHLAELPARGSKPRSQAPPHKRRK